MIDSSTAEQPNNAKHLYNYISNSQWSKEKESQCMAGPKVFCRLPEAAIQKASCKASICESAAWSDVVEDGQMTSPCSHSDTSVEATARMYIGVQILRQYIVSCTPSYDEAAVNLSGNPWQSCLPRQIRIVLFAPSCTKSYIASSQKPKSPSSTTPPAL